VSDIEALASVAREHGALLMVDNTFATPFHCQPLALGADVVIESVTKGMAGHFDVVLGAVAGRESVLGPVREFAISSGMIPSAFDAWLATRGLTTFALRQERAAQTATRLAAWLAARPVRAVHYPGLHALGRRVLRRGYGSVLSFELDVDRAGAERFVGALGLIRLVHSLGGPTTTLSHSLTMTHRYVEPSVKESLGLHDGFFRLSVGLEDPEDLEADLDAALSYGSFRARP
jgi:cystathionine gamma-synthase/methionine-gamma-lyase